MYYYRRTSKPTPMSDWGHAMFAADPRKIEGYGRYLWTLDASHCVPIDSLCDYIVALWNADRADGFADLSFIMSKYWHTVPGADIARDADPPDIVDSAGAWDSAFVQWFWERIAEPRGIMAVSTQDGAICFDQSLIMAASDEDVA